mgnify:CR=1 FL=1
MATNVNTIFNGSNGELWLNNADKLLKVSKFTFKQTNSYAEVDVTDNFAKQERLVGCSLSGEITKFQVDFAIADIMKQYKDGKQPDITLVGRVENPDTGVARRISITGITLQDMDIFAFEKGQANQDVIPFNASDYEYID